MSACFTTSVPPSKKTAMSSLCLLLLASSSLLLSTLPVAAKNTMEQLESFRDNSNSSNSILSSGNFTLHFSSIPNNTENRYLVISYVGNSFSRVVWVANRDTPITNQTGGVLNISAKGVLTLYQDSASKPTWSSSNTGSSSVRARLSNTGNLVVEEVASKRPVWQSFDHPTNTFLPGMKVGKDPKTGHVWKLTSWKSGDDPSTGKFSYVVHRGIHGAYEMHIVDNYNGDIRYRTGPWNDERFSGNPNLGSEVPDLFHYTFVSNESGEAYYSFKLVNSQTYVTSWFVLGWRGVAKREAVNRSGGLETLWTSGDAPCDKYGYCGKNGLCANDACTCLEGFEERRTKKVCSRKKELSCVGDQVRFERLPQVKIPDTSNATVDPGRSLGDCEAECRKNCTCVAYATAHIWDRSGCIQWYGDLLDARKYNDVPGRQDAIYLKMAAGKTHKKKVAIVVSIISVIAAILMVLCGACLWKKAKSRPRKEAKTGLVIAARGGVTNLELEELSLFDFATLASATRNFSERIGQGGFGVVYKGVLGDGQPVAVKRLSNTIPEHGFSEFLNEAVLIAKLQHRNLVRLLGCCTDGAERMLVFEYMCNKSLDSFIFNEEQRPLLQWKTRTNIILGVSRGLLYLHEDSRLKIIHRDLKAANVLLDEAMNPKISDFGTARIFMTDQSEDKTSHVIGTLGYISPEYAMDGTFSVKSDVFSFGVLMLEIIAGMKNMRPKNHDAAVQEMPDKNLLALAWRLWENGDSMKLLDKMIPNSHPTEVQRYVQIGLLCVQKSAAARPTMSEVNSMLTNEEKRLSKPNTPELYQGRVTGEVQLELSGSEAVGQITVTMVEGR